MRMYYAYYYVTYTEHTTYKQTDIQHTQNDTINPIVCGALCEVKSDNLHFKEIEIQATSEIVCRKPFRFATHSDATVNSAASSQRYSGPKAGTHAKLSHDVENVVVGTASCCNAVCVQAYSILVINTKDECIFRSHTLGRFYKYAKTLSLNIYKTYNISGGFLHAK